jgi:hypothetical protein
VEIGERGKVSQVAGERVEEANDGVLVALEEEEAIHGVEDAVVSKERKLDTDEGSCVEVEEANVVAELVVARVEAVTLWKHYPASRVEAWVNDTAAAWAHGAVAPQSADGAEADVVQEVAGQDMPCYQEKQVSRQGRRP